MLAAAVSALAGCDGGVSRADIAFVSTREGDYAIYVMNADGGHERRLTRRDVSNPTTPRQVFFQIEPAWSPDGSKIAFASARNNSKGSGLDIYVMDANGANVKQLTFAVRDDTAPAWSPDGSKIVFQSKRDDNPEVYVMNNDGTNQRRLTFNTKQDAEPSWGAGANAQKITFVSDRNGTLNVWAMDASGANQKQLTFTTRPDAKPNWSPDGTKILFSSKRGDNNGTVFDLYTMSPDGSNIVRLTNSKNGDFEGVYSRDGSRIALTTLRDGNQEIYTMAASGSQTTVMRLTTNSAADNQPDW
jgi:Tol biopolymer transport system component